MIATKHFPKIAMLTGFGIFMLILNSCDSNKDSSEKSTEEKSNENLAYALSKHPGSKSSERTDWGGYLTIHRQRHAQKNLATTYHQKLLFFDISEENEKVILTFQNFSGITFRIICQEEQVEDIISDSDPAGDEWLVFFKVTDFAKPDIFLMNDADAGATAGINLDDNNEIIAVGSLVELVRLNIY